jgi:glucose-1-phosphate thymidylyltransferase
MTNSKNDPVWGQEVVGLMPAGGQATRIAPLPCSKELYPVGFRSTGEDHNLRPKVVCHYLLERYRRAGATKTYIILRQGKWDIPTYLGDGDIVGMDLAYLMMGLPFGAPYTLDQAYPFVQEALIVFGFPDIIFRPEDAFIQLLDQQAKSKADIVLGLFLADQPHKMDMVALDDDGRVNQIVIKPAQTSLRYTWIIAVWTPTFTQFMHEYLLAAQTDSIQTGTTHGLSEQKELFVGDVIQAAIEAGLQVEKVFFPDGFYLDIGTPDNLIKAIRTDLLEEAS